MVCVEMRQQILQFALRWSDFNISFNIGVTKITKVSARGLSTVS